MAFVKFASAEAQVLGFKGRSSADKKSRTASLSKFGEYSNYRTDDDYLYVRVRAISSRVNKNHDGWPSDELEKSWRTFLGKPIFVDHHNSDPSKARGVVVDASIHVEDMEKTANLDPYYATAPDNHKPPTWIELLLEVDAKTFPKLASAIIAGDIDGVSMGCNVERSKCSHCGNWARSPEEYCKHIVSKGSYFDYNQTNGVKVSKRSYEDCYDIGFFEISCVFDPADETALMRDLITAKTSSVRAGVYGEGTLMGGDSGGSYGDPAAIAGQPNTGQFPGVSPHEFPMLPDNRSLELSQLLGDPLLAEKIAAIYQHSMATTNSPETAASYAYESLMNMNVPEEKAQQIVGILYSMSADAAMPADDLPYSPQPANGGHPPGTFLHDSWGNDPFTSKTALFGLNEKCKHCGHELDPDQKHPRRCEACGFAQNEPSQKDYLMQHEPGVIRTAESNPLPQSEMMVAPAPVDTMRKEQLCPICGSDMEEGVCQVCNFQEPPEGFDNPNLDKAKERAESQPEPEAPGGPDAGGTPPGGGAPPASPEMQPSSPQAMSLTGSKTRTNSKVSDEMGQWTVVLTSKTASGNEGGRINTQERPILPATRQNSDKPSGAKTVKDSLKPVESTHKEMAMSQKTADGVGASPGGSGVDAEKRVDVMGVGSVDDSPEKGTKHVNVEKQVDIERIHTDTWSGDEGDSLGQQEPTTDEVGSGGMTAPIGQPVSHTVTADGAWGSPGEGGGKGFPDHEPTRIDVQADLAEEVGDPTMTWSGTDGNNVYRQQDPTTPDLGSGGMTAPIGEPAPTKSLRSHIFRAMKLAETEVELGITEDGSKWDRAAELEEHTPSELEAVEKTLAKVKTSGLRKAAAAPMQRKASSLPSLQGPRIETEASVSGDEQLFLR